MNYKKYYDLMNDCWFSGKEAKKIWAKYFPENQLITPSSIVQNMVDKANIDWTNPNLKICDPCCGSGSFLIYCLIKLLEAGHSEQHIIENMLYGSDIEPKCIEFIEKFWKFNKYNHNLKSSSILNKEWDFRNMKFDLIIMNPPYDKDLHLKIIEKVFNYITVNGQLINLSPDAWLINPYREFDNSNMKNKALTKIATHISDFEHISVEDTNKLFGTSSWFGVGIFVLVKNTTSFNINQFLTGNKLVYKLLTKIKELPSFRSQFVDKNNNTNLNTFVCVRRNNHKYLEWCEKDNKSVNATQGIQFKSLVEANNFINSVQNTWLYKYLNKTDWNNSENSASVPFMQDYTKPWDNKRFCDYFNITGYISDTTAVAGSEWEEILNTLK